MAEIEHLQNKGEKEQPAHIHHTLTILPAFYISIAALIANNIYPEEIGHRMKHDLKITLFLVVLFFASQVIGLYLLNSIGTPLVSPEGNITVNYSSPIMDRPDLEENEAFPYIFIMILVGTGLLFLLMKFRLFGVWKAWFFLAVWGALSLALSVLVGEIPSVIIALVLTVFKIFKPNVIVHNLTEVFIYAGINIMIAPLFSVFWASILLIAISIYDAIAVWKSKHMVVLAEAQSENKLFAGMLIPYKVSEEAHEVPEKKHSKKQAGKPSSSANITLQIPKDIRDDKVRSAILGGGDIAFPMIFTSSVMRHLIESGSGATSAFFLSLIVSLATTIALGILFWKSEKGKFYPAMPFISAGCFAGLGIVLLLRILI
jgi:presenilin-like A22 family membrane protease